jgi:hypothetical protein
MIFGCSPCVREPFCRLWKNVGAESGGQTCPRGISVYYLISFALHSSPSSFMIFLWLHLQRRYSLPGAQTHQFQRCSFANVLRSFGVESEPETSGLNHAKATIRTGANQPNKNSRICWRGMPNGSRSMQGDFILRKQSRITVVQIFVAPTYGTQH